MLWRTTGVLLLLAAMTAGCGVGGLNLDELFGGAVGGIDQGSDTNGTDDTNDTDGVGDDGDEFGISGTVLSFNSAKRQPRSQDTTPDSGFLVIAQSETGEIYTGRTDSAGEFEIEVPEPERGNVFTVAIVGQDGRAQGPVLLGTSGQSGITGMNLNEGAELGEILLPQNPATDPILVGDGANTAGLLAGDVIARLDPNGVPVGVATIGKGESAEGEPVATPRQAFDQDRDGLIDILDADNDGDGVVDDLDAGSQDVGGVPGAAAGVSLNFFTNLKITGNDAQVFYTGTQEQREDALRERTVVTFEVQAEPTSGKTITGVRLLDAPAPAYLTDMTVQIDTGFGLAEQPWSAVDFAFQNNGDRWQAFCVPHALINAGDTFFVEVSFADGTSAVLSRMINYVFTNIPRLRQFGPAGTLADYASGDVDFDGSQHLTLVFNPPQDETGAFLTGYDYFFEFFYHDAGGAQINGINRDATWPTPVPGQQTNLAFVVPAAELVLSDSNTFSVTLPAELFVDEVVTGSGTVTVGHYVIDLSAQNNSNAALKLRYNKQ